MSTFLKQYGECSGAFGFPMYEEDARNLDKFLNDNEEEDVVYFRKFRAKDQSAPVFGKDRTDVSVITDDTVDSDKEVVIPENVNWEVFRKRGGIVAYGHNYKIPPVGRSLWQKKIGKSWRAKTEYAPRPKSLPDGKEWFPDSVFSMIREGFLPGKSIGGVAKRRNITKEDLEKCPHWEGAKRVIYDSTVYEYSVVSVQANHNAIVEAVSKGLISLPEDVISSDFPEVEEMLRDIKKSKELPVIKEYNAVSSYRSNLQRQLEMELGKTYDRLPEMVDDILQRMMGKV